MKKVLFDCCCLLSRTLPWDYYYVDGLLNKARGRKRSGSPRVELLCRSMWCRACLYNRTIHISRGSNSLFKNICALKILQQKGHRDVFISLRMEPGAAESELISLSLTVKAPQRKGLPRKPLPPRSVQSSCFKCWYLELIACMKVFQVWSYPQSLTLILNSPFCRRVSAVISDLIHPQTNSTISLPFSLQIKPCCSVPSGGLSLTERKVAQHPLHVVNLLATASNHVNIPQPNISSHLRVECLLVSSSLQSTSQCQEERI